MGPILNKNSNSVPQKLSYQNAKDVIKDLNTFCRQNAKGLNFVLKFEGSTLKYNHYNWKTSIIRGTICIQRQTNKIVYNVMMSLQKAYNVHQITKHFQLRTQKLYNQTPNPKDSEQFEKQCCICFEMAPTMMLPCFHSFCPACTQKHIIQKQQKKCPICRAQFHEDNNSLKSKIITVVGEEQNFIIDLRNVLLDSMKQFSNHQIVQIQKILAREDQQKSDHKPLYEKE